MMGGTLVYTGRLVELREGPRGRVGRLSVHGARVEVVLDLVPEAAAGDEVLVHAGVALAVIHEALETADGEEGD
jgi:hydrogenase maturation factor